jgi:hypothetical protein
MSFSPRRHYEGTQVPESKSLLDIEFMLRRHGVEAVRWTSTPDVFRIEFTWPYRGDSLAFRIDLKIPAQDNQGHNLPIAKRDQERRRMLRVLLNHVKAKLVAVEEGLVDMEQEFLPYLIGPGNRTVGEIAGEQLATGQMPAVFPLLEAGS